MSNQIAENEGQTQYDAQAEAQAGTVRSAALRHLLLDAGTILDFPTVINPHAKAGAEPWLDGGADNWRGVISAMTDATLFRTVEYVLPLLLRAGKATAGFSTDQAVQGDTQAGRQPQPSI